MIRYENIANTECHWNK